MLEDTPDEDVGVAVVLCCEAKGLPQSSRWVEVGQGQQLPEWSTGAGAVLGDKPFQEGAIVREAGEEMGG